MHTNIKFMFNTYVVFVSMQFKMAAICDGTWFRLITAQNNRTKFNAL